MKQTSRIISTYSADTFGVCSALFELGGMTVMHDASGCNSTYTTHDEPRWYDMDSMVYISGLSEMDHRRRPGASPPVYCGGGHPHSHHDRL